MAGKTGYKNNWQKENVDRINLTVPKGHKEVIQSHAASQSESVNGFIKRAIEEIMEQDNAGIFSAQIRCPYCDCGRVWSEDLSDYVIARHSCERQMGDEVEHIIEADFNCPQCERSLEVTGTIWEYPAGAQNYVDLKARPSEEAEK